MSIAHPTGVADAVAADLAYEAQVLRERIAALQGDVAVYRLIAVTAFDVLRELAVKMRGQEQKNDQLANQLRALREQALVEAGTDETEAA